ncbi:Phosphoenolpyruvate-protein phosphotransferase [Slackia heliotrinireducens]|uniref:Phosphoenolpyruvate-protein phosphotransferase n=1 Tax=Slackia heliotrinireducens (strain ATCC 29202 / DSM 20476 / NCTC 11029 / RHS 1) TaxID=471855 RepID=C7N615_SLAHD|nr:phosphoenolpyruvate--protein phosphotransferase [Slackia heliotrinireducens]ACV22350.1 phosphoenolpyruvate--protein phosphotransferase [Slackia heliotrinireducens DSM 20476]VEH00604.1 Phosphoenolpyruvate-protein phosphotransferase [Slackia heliotrinireducens]
METLTGVGASAGIGIGRVMIVEEPTLEYVSHTVTDTEAEKARFQAAVDAYIEKTQAEAEAMKETVGEKEAEILTGHILMISDPGMTGQMTAAIDGGTCAEDALSQVCDMFASIFEGSGDELLMQRATDVRDIKTGILAKLLNKREVDLSKLPADTVVVTHDLTPSMTAGVKPGGIAGVITEVGGMTSHSAILARAMEIPAILSIPGVCSKLADGTQVIVNGTLGSVIAEPDEATLTQAEEARHAFIVQQGELKKFIGCATVTADGVHKELFANIGKPDDANQANDKDAEGIGLFRTEFLFMDSPTVPTEDQQFDAYKKTALIMKGKPVIIRTLDIGGDKDVPCLGMEKEDNPFMGFRAIRYCLAREDVYRTQLRALLRASAFGDIRIMVPLVTCVDEIRQVKALVKRYMEEFDREGVEYNPDIQVGVMMETPAAALVADLLAAEADFFSIGTNDLTGYTMAADRGNDRVRYLYNTYNPAVLRSIRNIIECGNAAGIMVGMCGEAAADPLLIPLWIAFGLGEFSVSATSVLATRKEIFGWTVEDAKELADRVMAMSTASEVYEALQAAHDARI